MGVSEERTHGLEVEKDFENRLSEIADLGRRHRGLDDLLNHISNPKDHDMPRPELLREIVGDIQKIAYSDINYDQALKEVNNGKNAHGSGVGNSSSEGKLRQLAVSDVVKYIEDLKENRNKTPPDHKILATAEPLLRTVLVELEKRLNDLVVGSIDLKTPGRFINILTALIGGRSEYGKVYLLSELQDIIERGASASRNDKTVTKEMIVELLTETDIDPKRIKRVLKTKPLSLTTS